MTAIPQIASLPSRVLDRSRLWVLCLAATIAYIALITGDVYVADVPLKILMVGATLGTWWAFADAPPKLLSFRFAVPALMLGLAVPVLWSLIAGLYAVIGDSVTHSELRHTIQHASRFAYILLYFPLADLGWRRGAPATLIWLLPVYGLCLVTIGIWLVHLATGDDFGVIELFVFKGIIGDAPEGFRVFIGNHVLLIPAFGLLLASFADRRAVHAGWGMALLIAAAYLSHTRGIWLGLSSACAITVVLLGLRLAPTATRALVIGAGAAAGAAIGFAVLMLAGEIDRPGFLSDGSAGSRVEQAGPLWDAFLAHPVLGSGLGAALDSGYAREPDAPWSFELTYLQVLFQMGVIGLAALFWLPIAIIVKAGRWVVSAPAISVNALGAAAGTVGILVASATNPYLLSSFGMLSLVIAASLAEPFPVSGRPGSRES